MEAGKQVLTERELVAAAERQAAAEAAAKAKAEADRVAAEAAAKEAEAAASGRSRGSGRGARRGGSSAERGGEPVTEIPAALVKQLRDMTGAGMMECKRALVETEGDLDAAVTLLREKGLAAASKRAGRETNEGEVKAHVNGSRGAVVAVGCETEPVSGNEEFLAYVQHVLDLVEVEGPDAAAKLDEERIQLVAKLGENIEVRGAARMEAGDGEVVSAYVHPPANKLGVLLRLRGSEELARMLAMHIAASRPEYLTRDEVSHRRDRARAARSTRSCPRWSRSRRTSVGRSSTG